MRLALLLIFVAGCGAKAALTPDASGDAAPADVPAEVPEMRARTPYRALAVATGRLHTCALLDDHRVKCWGDNSQGQLGLGNTRPRGDRPAEMGDGLPAVDLGTGRTATAIAAGHYATCAILDDGSVKCWGIGAQTGLGSPGGANTGRGDQPGEMGDALPSVDLGPGRTAKRLVVGYYQTCAQLDDDAYRCWDWADSLTTIAAPGPPGRRLVDLQAATSALALFDDGTVNGLGTGGFTPSDIPEVDRKGLRAAVVGGSRSKRGVVLEAGGLLCESPISPSPEALAHARALAFGEEGVVFCGLVDGGRVNCWNLHPELRALVSDEPSPDGSTVFLALGQPSLALAGGGLYHMCALLADGGVKCWALAIGVWPTVARAFGGTAPGVFGATGWAEIDLGTHPVSP